MWLLLASLVHATPALEESTGPSTTRACVSNMTPRGYVVLEEHVPLARLTYRNHGANNPTGAPLPGYGATVMWLREEAADRLVEVTHDLATENLGLIVFDAYRPLRADQAREAWLLRTSQGHLLDNGLVERLTHHPTGYAVDVSLYNLHTGEPLDMGTQWADWSENSRYDKSIWPGQTNRAVLREVMNRHDFQGTGRSWWHYRLRRHAAPRLNTPYGAHEPNAMDWHIPHGWKNPLYSAPHEPSCETQTK
jgi:D-alanyl-D-alanine dipeptidase